MFLLKTDALLVGRVTKSTITLLVVLSLNLSHVNNMKTETGQSLSRDSEFVNEHREGFNLIT